MADLLGVISRSSDQAEIRTPVLPGAQPQSILLGEQLQPVAAGRNNKTATTGARVVP
jgi:hypothetical protein